MSTGIGCTLYIDGERFADGQPTESPLDPVALAGLSITWGRSTTVDQPDTSTCTFKVMDAHGGRGFLDELTIGLTIDVTATAFLYPDPTEGTFLDPDFQNPDTPVILSAAAGAASDGVFVITPHDAARRAGAIFAPAPFQAAGQDPAAWDDIPSTSPGQTWNYTVRVRTAPGGTAVVRPVLFTGPWKSAAIVIDKPVTVPASDDWVDITGTFEPTLTGAWVGVQVSAYPNGDRWIDLDRALAWDDVDPGWTWLDMAETRVDSVDAYAPAGGVERDVLVFSGRITDLAAGWDDATDAVLVDVTAQDFTADLANTRVGDEPWAVETMAARFQRIMTLSGIPVAATIDPTVTDTLVSYQDVDSQAAADLLRDLAQTVDGVMWSATHQTTGPYLHVEDPALRATLSHLELVDGSVEIVNDSDVVGRATTISACDILRDPVQWKQDVSDVTTRAAVGWMEQGVDEEGKTTTTDRTYTLVDATLEASLGQRGISVSTLLQAEAEAMTVADRVLARTSQSGWRADGLYIDDDTIDTANAAAVVMMLDLLDGTLRNGRPLLLTDLPDWTPTAGDVGVFLEGGTYAFDEGQAGMTWQLSLTVSNSAGAGQTLAWDEVDPGWTWDQFGRDITWLDLHGVGPEILEDA